MSEKTGEKGEFKGASTESLSGSQAAPFGGAPVAAPAAAPVGGAPPLQKSPDTKAAEASGAADPVPVHQGNQHMVLGAPPVSPENDPSRVRPATEQSTVVGPGTEHPNAGVTRTAGEPESAVAPIRQEGNTVILEEQTAESTRPEFEPGRPKPRTDVDADPHEVTTPGFQGLDRVNPLPPTVPPDHTIEHRGAPNEPRVTNVMSVGEPPVRAVGSESPEAKLIDGGMSPEDAQRQTQHPTSPEPQTSTGSEDEAKPKQGKLPDDFPGASDLANNDINTYAQLRKAMADETWPKNVTGIGPATSDKITEALKADN